MVVVDGGAIVPSDTATNSAAEAPEEGSGALPALVLKVNILMRIIERFLLLETKLSSSSKISSF